MQWGCEGACAECSQGVVAAGIKAAAAAAVAAAQARGETGPAELVKIHTTAMTAVAAATCPRFPSLQMLMVHLAPPDDWGHAEMPCAPARKPSGRTMQPKSPFFSA